MVLAVIALSGVVGSAFSNNFTSGNSPSQRAQNLLAQRFPAQAGDTADVVIHTTGQVNDPANAATIDRLVAALRAAPECHRACAALWHRARNTRCRPTGTPPSPSSSSTRPPLT